MKSVAVIFVLFAASVFINSVASSAEYIWWEGENPSSSNFPARTWFSTGAIQGKENLLSAGKWLTNEGKRTGPEAFAKYEITVAQAGEYDLWSRKFWKHGSFQWRFDEQPWGNVGNDVSLADSVEIVTNLSANWVYLGKVSLSEGKHTFELRLLAKEGESLTACFDCFLLTQIPFVPRGKLKPDEKSGLADPGFFAWEPAYDPFTEDALLDLRFLNEASAGESGFIKSEGDDFVLGNGKPVRFWGVNASSSIAGLERKSIQHLARLLAKRGVNIVRYHSPLFDRSDPMKVDPQALDDLFFLIKAMKDEGIYTKISFYFPLWFDIQPHYGIPGYENAKSKKPFALLYFDEKMQAIYKSWAKALLTTNNPYTGQSLANEPAVAMVEIINEDSYFFWTFTKANIPPLHWQHLEKLYGDWLLKKYGSFPNAYAAWNNTRDSGDNASEGRMALYEAWNMTGDAVRQSGQGKVKRIGDQVRFLTENQRGFYQSMKGYFKQELGSKSLVTTSNWTVTDPFTLGALERFTYMAGDAIDRHGYSGGDHTSSDGTHSYSVRVGHTFKNLGGVKAPKQLPLQLIQIEGFPHLISEIGWTNPDLYRADYSFLASAYGSLQGIDALFAFALGGAGWDTSMNKFALSCPAIMGNFPAYALMYRRGDVQTADPVIRQILDVNQLFAMKGSGDMAEQSLDDLRFADVPPAGLAMGEVKNIDPLAFYVGRVLRTFSGDPAKSQEMNLSSFIDKEKQTVSSLTGELFWDHGKGIATVNTSKAQGAAGFLSQSGTISLKDIGITCQNEYATLLAVTLDNRPLADSGSILVQAMTVERPYGFNASEGKEGTIQNTGGYPFGVEKVKMTVDIHSNRAERPAVLALDENGYSTQREIQISGGENGAPWRFALAEDAVYYIVKWDSETGVKSSELH